MVDGSTLESPLPPSSFDTSVLGLPNLPCLRVRDLADPAAKTLLLRARVLYA